MGLRHRLGSPEGVRPDLRHRPRRLLKRAERPARELATGRLIRLVTVSRLAAGLFW
jgi:hypothetical protein